MESSVHCDDCLEPEDVLTCSVIDNALALVGSPDTVVRKIEEQHALIGHDMLCTQHGFGQMALDLVWKSIRLFGKNVIPTFA